MSSLDKIDKKPDVKATRSPWDRYEAEHRQELALGVKIAAAEAQCQVARAIGAVLKEKFFAKQATPEERKLFRLARFIKMRDGAVTDLELDQFIKEDSDDV